MSTVKAPARLVARGSETDVWIDHARITVDDLEWLKPVEVLTIWAVELPVGFLGQLPNLRVLDIRGGSAQTLEVVAGCTQLRGLILNQIRGLHDISDVGGLVELELLSLYGLPRLRVPAAFDGLTRLARLELGSLKGLETLKPMLRAPALRELQLSKMVALTEVDIALIMQHPTLEMFGWNGEDVPVRTWLPVVEQVGLPSPRIMFPRDWLAANDGPR